MSNHTSQSSQGHNGIVPGKIFQGLHGAPWVSLVDRTLQCLRIHVYESRIGDPWRLNGYLPRQHSSQSDREVHTRARSKIKSGCRPGVEFDNHQPAPVGTLDPIETRESSESGHHADTAEDWRHVRMVGDFT